MHKNKIAIAVLTGIFALSGCNGQSEANKTSVNTEQKISAESPDYWQDLSVFKVNTEEPRATFVPYDKVNKVANDDYASSPYYKLLNGNWKFNWSFFI